MASELLYPLLSERHLEQRLWGGDRLGPWLGLPNPPAQLAEAWQVWDTNTITNGSLAGHTLADAAKRYGAALVGTRPFARYGADMPLLAKFIDAAEPLSVQVHPDDAYAHSVEAASGFHGKTEAWYILAAEPDAELIYGLNRPATRAEVAQAIADETLLELLNRVSVAPGDVIMVPAGTIHAIGRGVTLFEIQQKSDLTYRLYDYGRRDAKGNLRELHVEQGLDVSDLAGTTYPKALPLPLDATNQRHLLVACPFFALERLQLDGPLALATDAGSLELYTALDGTGQLVAGDSSVELTRGVSAVLPATLGGYSIQPHAALTLLRCYVPDLERDLLAPLRAQGTDEAQIARSVFPLAS
jgi:mannose-6-phosphate isomerase